MDRRKAVYPFVIALYLIIILPVVFFRYQQIKESAEERIGERLYAAARTIHFYLNDRFHDTWTPENPLPEERLREMRAMLASYAELFHLEHVYSLVRREGRIYRVIGDASADPRGPAGFYEVYADPPDSLREAFETEQVFYNFSRADGGYHSVFLPHKTPSGTLYVLGADIDRGECRAQLKEGTAQLALMVFFLLAPFVPFFILLAAQGKNRERYLLSQLYTDSLTGLPNRKKFILDKNEVITRDTSAIMLDIDSFREINNLFGGKVGDLVLVYTADLIRSHCSPEDLLYKFPADEFILLLRNKSREEVLETTEEILKAFLSGSFVTKGQSLNLTISAGVVYRPGSQRRLLSSANIAKNQAKRDGKGYVLYDDSMNLEEQYARNYFWLNQLKEALKEERIVPYYQPILNNRTYEIEKYEALVRMIDRRGEAVPPSAFLTVAKRSKLYKQITHVMVERSFRDFQDKPYKVSINLTVQDLLDEETVAFILQSMERYRMHGRVVFELLESESLMEIDNFRVLLNRFRREGIGIAIDDFGSGYSNFGYLSKVPMDYLKIDGFIIRSLLKSKSSEAALTAISAFSRDLGIPLIAEFVPCATTLAKLQELGVEFSQGYYIGKPAPFEELPRRADFLVKAGEERG